MGLKSDFNDLAEKLESKSEELHEIASKLDGIKNDLHQIRSDIKTKAEHMTDDQSS
jgi:hypothetical protein